MIKYDLFEPHYESIKFYWSAPESGNEKKRSNCGIKSEHDKNIWKLREILLI
jgi:hypothetical protein